MTDDLDFDWSPPPALVAAPRRRRRRPPAPVTDTAPLEPEERNGGDGGDAAPSGSPRVEASPAIVPGRLSVTLEPFGNGWKAWIGDGDDPNIFGLSALSVQDPLPWHALWRLANDMRIAAERGTMTIERIRECHTRAAPNQ